MENNEAETVKIEPATEPPKENGTKPAQVSNKEKKNKDEKSRKKDDRSIEQILKSLSGETPEEKLTAMCKKYIEVIDENRKLQASLKQSEKHILMIQREKEQIQSEKSKAILMRSRLESLCRELQRQNNAVKEESLMKIREEEEKRKEVSAKFQSTLTEITALMAETNEKNVKLHEDNIEIHKKFKSVFDEMDIREQHFEGMHQMMKHELQVAEAKLAKITLEMTEEKEKLLKDKNTLLLKLAEYQAQIVQLQHVESNLRSQVEMYTDKYDEFQSALTKSNEVFGGFNDEMTKMSKKILKLEKETQIWKTRWEKSHSALLEMAADKQTRDNEVVKLNKKCSLLQELCRAIQQERSTLLNQLKQKNSISNSVETNDQLSAQDNQVTNESLLINGTNTKIEKQTKESKTETNYPENDKVDEVNVSEPNTEVQDPNVDTKLEKNIDYENSENVNEKTLNNEKAERFVDVTSTETEEFRTQINDNDKTSVQKNSLNCKKEETTLQVPVEVKDPTQNEAAICNPKESTKPSEKNVEQTSPVMKSPDVTDSAIELSVNNRIAENPKETANIIENEKVIPNGKHHIEKTSTVIPNGEVRSNTVSNKKHKEGKKKRK